MDTPLFRLLLCHQDFHNEYGTLITTPSSRRPRLQHPYEDSHVHAGIYDDTTSASIHNDGPQPDLPPVEGPLLSTVAYTATPALYTVASMRNL